MEISRKKFTFYFCLCLETSKWLTDFSPCRNGINSKKYRRHTNDVTYQHQKPNGSTRRKAHPETYSSSQLSIEVSELHAGINGRLEITCVSTIPASVGPGEQFADYKTFSVKGEKSFLWFSLECKQLKMKSFREEKLLHFSAANLSIKTLSQQFQLPSAR